MIVRAPSLGDVPAMAAVHVRCWQETYRGVMPDEVLDDPGFVAAREQMWNSVVAGAANPHHRCAVAEDDGTVIGIALSGRRPAEGELSPRELFVLYVVRAEHGGGAGAALLDVVVDPAEPAMLWVLDPNPRAQAFYAKHGFVADGAVKVEDGVREIRMVRSAGGT